MKPRLLLLCLMTLLLGSTNAQQLIQGTIKKGSNDQQVEIWLKPNFSNSTQYLAQIGLPIAIPTSAAPQPTGITVTQDPTFTAAFGTNYAVTINPAAFNTGSTEKYFNVVMIRSGGGASNPQSWTEGVEFKVLTITFNYSGAPATFQAKLADYQDGGSDGQGFFYTADGNANYYITTNSIQNFYASPNNSIIGGTAGAGYAQIMAAVNAGTVSGTSPLCIDASATYSTNGDAGGKWSSSNTAVATVNATTGLVNAVGAGTSNITYTISGVSAFKELTVNPNVSAGTVSGSSPLCIGASTTYSSNGTAGGSWSSSNTAVATVDANSGLVTAVGAGTSNITYTVNSGCGSPVSSFATLTVNPNVTAGTVSGTSPLIIGQTDTYTSNGTGGGSWSSSNTSVATVNSTTGLVSALSVGTSNITYTVNSGCGSPVSSFKALTVNAPTNAGTVSGTSPLCIGASTTYSSNGDAGGSWSSTNTSVATVNASTGLVTAVGAGTSDITYTINGVSSFKTLTVNPNVSAGTVTGSSPLCIGGSATYSSNGTSGGSWSSSNTAVATVNATTGQVTAVGAGSTNITYTVNSGCGSPVSAFASLTVNANVTAGTVSGSSPLCIGASTTFSSNGTSGGTWSSGNTGVATVDPNSGLVTAVGAGSTNITYTVNSGCGSPVSAFAPVTVNPNVTAGTVSGTSPLTVGQTDTYTSNGTAGGSWSSSNTSVATVNSSTGLVTAVGAGTTNITYTINSGCGSPLSSFKALTVNAPTNAGTVSGTSPLCIGASATYSSNGDAGGSWSSTNTSVASVNASTGLVTAVGAGTTDITYTVNGVSAFKTLTVNGNVSAGTVTGTSPLCIGGGATYTSNGTSGGSWSSSNTAVATVNASTGAVTAVGAGTTNITYTVNTGCGSPVSAFATLTVNPSVSAGTVSGTSPLCIDGTATYTSNGAAGGTWSSSNTSVATVNATTGLVTAINTGTANIIYTVNTGCGSPVSNSKTLTVNALPVVAAITGNTTITAGSTSQLSDATAGGTWSSNNTGVATVNASTGLVTAVAQGTATINYAVTNGCGTTTVSTTVTVNPLVLSLIQGTIKPGAASNEVEVWLKPDFSNSTEYLAQIGLPVAWPTGATQPSSVNVTLDPSFTTNFGSNYSVSIYPVAHNTANTENYVTIVLVRDGAGASAAQTWTAGAEFKVLTATFNPSSSPNSKVKLADYQDGGSDGQGSFYTASGNANYYITSNSIGNFYAAPGLSTVGGNASAGFAETNNTVGCSNPTVDPITGTTTVCSGATTQLSSTTAGGTWSSNNTGVATVNPTTGLVTGVGAGTATITYLVTNSCGSNSVTATVTVNGKPTVAAITGSTTICVSGTTQLSSATAGGTWSSSNTSAATVDQTGLVTGVGGGTTTISYELSNSCGTTTVTANVTVNTAPVVAAITGTTTITVGGTSTLSSATAGGTWSSGTTSVATINASTGKVTAVAPGTSLISYTVTNSCGPTTVTTTVTVEAAVVKLIQGTIKPGATSNDIEVWLKSNFNNNSEYLAQIGMPIAWSASLPNQPSALNVTLDPAFTAAFGNNYTVTVNPVANNTGNTEKYFNIVLIRGGAGASDPQTWTAGTEFKVLTASFTPATSPNGPVKLADYQDAGSDGQGNFYTASGNADYYITNNSIENFYASPGNSTVGGNAAAGYAQTINNIGCTAPVVAPITGTTTVCVGSTTQLSSTTAGGVWSSNNAAATVDANGLVTGVSTGSAEIRYTVTTACGTNFVTATVTVNDKPEVAAITGTTTVCAGSTTQLSSITPGGVWSSNNASATVDANGLVTSVSAGTATISYAVTNSCGTTTVTATVTVNDKPVVAAIAGTGTVCVGSTTQLSDATLGGIWSSNNVASATVDANGLVTGVSAGSATISYAVTNACGTTTVTKIVTVNGNANAGTVSGTTPLCIGGTAQYSSTGTAGGTWSSSNPSVATVNATGLVTAKATGTTNITYTVNGCNGQVSSFQALTVTTGTAGNPGVVNGPSPQCTESVVKYTTTGTSGGTWSSTNTSVAIVNSKNGQVTTVGVGTTNITYTVEGCGGPVSAFKTLTVTGPPTITATNITVNLTSSNCLQMVSFGSNVTVTNGSNIVYKIGNKMITSPAAFPTGQSFVTVSASNNCGTRSTSFIVNVKDLIDPVITCPGNITTTSTTSCTRSVNTPNPVFSDNCKVERVAWKLTGATTGSSPTNGMYFVGTKTFNVGVTKVTYTVWDASENAQSCSFNVTVTPTGKCTGTSSFEELITINSIKVSAFPNPSNHFFQLRINSTNRKDEVYIKIMDITGRQLQQFKGQADKLYRFGDGLAAGTYVVEVRQGTQRTTTKVIKAN